MLSDEQIINIANIECIKQGWSFHELFIIKEYFNFYEVRTNINNRGGNVIVKIDANLGIVTNATITPR